ncbi:AAA family ATPase [Simiduia curdlanivorans]|uniref:ExeA family protein n=1 Tax=Simiduia curdlanivorans TaxID=1492769 RepID=A0ABV8V3Y4_9GAMM|nr:AAA family ATPase [Simiduia curdlanivorans]MDN3640182.1 AAA family ATPase [Simiduia curdlanivorans]
MYTEFFGLQEKPFSLTPDTQFFFNKQSHRAALNTMLGAVQNNEGFIKIVGEVGTGKTLLCRKLLSLLDGKFKVIYIPNSYLTPNELKGLVAAEIGAEFAADMPAYQLMGSIYRKLLQLVKDSVQVVLIVDEAQAMPRDTLESLRLLTNLDTEKRKLLQVVLIGQPELDETLERSDLRQLKQRIVFTARLQPLTSEGVAEYVGYRMSSAGCDRLVFSKSALLYLYWSSGGIPRLVNLLAHKALIAAFNAGDTSVNSEHLAIAINNTPEARRLGRFVAQGVNWLWPVAGGAGGILLSAYLGSVMS